MATHEVLRFDKPPADTSLQQWFSAKRPGYDASDVRSFLRSIVSRTMVALDLHALMLRGESVREVHRMYDLLFCLLYLGSVIIVPFVMMLGGYVMRHLDSDQNRFVGYRTALSMSSPEAWLYANHACGRLWKRIGLILLLASPAAMGVAVGVLWPDGLSTERSALICMVVLLVIIAVQIGVMLWSIWHVEKSLRRQIGDHKLQSSEAKNDLP